MQAATKGPCGITLDWLYESIQSHQREAKMKAHDKFIAARTIQKLYRGYQVRRALEICQKMAIIIQRYYRGYKAREYFYLLAEKTTQKLFEDKYDYHATMIQKTFRGFYSRKYVHDNEKLRQKQRAAAKELILCVAHKLHHLLRTRQIPGVYSLRNSHCLSKVEELLASLRFKEYNEHVRMRRALHLRKMASVSITQKDGTVKLSVPFGVRCQETYQKYSIGELHNVLDEADTRKRIVPPKQPRPVAVSQIIQPDDGVYAKVVSSLERCNIVKFDDMSVCPNVINRPEKIEQFCNEMTNICHSQRLCF